MDTIAEIAEAQGGWLLRILRNAFTINNTDLTKHVAAEAQSSAVIQKM